MKICFTEKEVEAIVREHVERVFGVTRPMVVRLSNYSSDYCVVSEPPKEATNSWKEVTNE
jgi:hypothetical protein